MYNDPYIIMQHWLQRPESIVEVREEADVLGWMQQLGMELKPKEADK